MGAVRLWIKGGMPPSTEMNANSADGMRCRRGVLMVGMGGMLMGVVLVRGRAAGR